MDESSEACAELVVAGCDAAELLEFVEEALNEVALTIECLFPAEALPAPAHVGDVGNGTAGLDVGSEAVGIIGLVGDDYRASLKVGQERFGRRQIVGLARCDQDLDRPALAVDAGVDLGRKPPATAPHATIATVFFTPEAC